MIADAPPRNNIGVLRLLLACFVIIGHSPELIDGDRSREPIFRIFHHYSLGGIGVAGFFLLSGYLITASMLKTNATVPYLERRVLRIFPGYLVAYTLSLVVLGILMGLDYRVFGFVPLTNAIFLHEPPILFGQIPLHYPMVNGALWTISFEFRCYLIVLLLWKLKCLARSRVMAVITGMSIALAFMSTFNEMRLFIDIPEKYRLFDLMVGTPSKGILLLATFLVGSCTYLYRQHLLARLDGRLATVGLAASLLALFVPHLADIGIFALGFIPLFYLAFVAKLGALQRINDRWDISYGTYLYGWPVATTILYFNRSISPLVLSSTTVAIAMLLGACSWWGIERRAKAWARPVSRASLPVKGRTPADSNP